MQAKPGLLPDPVAAKTAVGVSHRALAVRTRDPPGRVRSTSGDLADDEDIRTELSSCLVHGIAGWTTLPKVYLEEI